jgi:single-stranded DNA-binding protein
LVYIEGRLQTDRYEEKGETRFFTKVVASRMQMLERRPEEEEPALPDADEEVIE